MSLCVNAKLLWVVNGIADLLLFMTRNRTLDPRVLDHRPTLLSSLYDPDPYDALDFFPRAVYLTEYVSKAGKRQRKHRR